MKQQQQGFTLIELIVVIVILGILAATALPKFVDLGSDARRSTISGAEGAIRSAANMAHAAGLAKGSLTATINVEGTDYTLVNGYPATTDIGALAGLQAGGYTESPAGTFQANGATTPASCFVSYTQAASSAVPPSIPTPTTGGC